MDCAFCYSEYQLFTCNERVEVRSAWRPVAGTLSTHLYPEPRRSSAQTADRKQGIVLASMLHPRRQSLAALPIRSETLREERGRVLFLSLRCCLLQAQLISSQKDGDLLRHQVQQLRIGQPPKHHIQPSLSRDRAARRSQA